MGLGDKILVVDETTSQIDHTVWFCMLYGIYQASCSMKCPGIKFRQKSLLNVESLSTAKRKLERHQNQLHLRL